jgi:hypothetical protein
LIQTKADVKFDDGWAHSEDDSIEGMKRELDGMFSNDRHEQAVASFEAGVREKAEQRKQQLEERLIKRQREMVETPRMVVRTEAEVRAREESLQNKVGPVVQEETQSSVADRLAKYK